MVIATKYFGSTFDGSDLDMVTGADRPDELPTAAVQHWLLFYGGMTQPAGFRLSPLPRTVLHKAVSKAYAATPVTRHKCQCKFEQGFLDPSMTQAHVHAVAAKAFLPTTCQLR